ncbi:PIG-L family deacetylase [Cereibacter sp. SYSU M97828]|nr:PIG-L family deacetylase [Cereibacter flavus]
MTLGAPMTPAELIEGRPLVVLAPHPDDETLGCGALLFDAAAAGIETRVICVTDGSRSHPNSTTWPPARLAAQRRRELEAATAQLGAEMHWLGHPDCGVPEDVPLDHLIPADALVLASWGGDPHCDHESVARLAQKAQRQDTRLAFYPVWGRFTGSRIVARPLVATAMALAAKRRALACHRSQMTPMITDDPEGFVMEDWRQAHFLEHPEVVIASS